MKEKLDICNITKFSLGLGEFIWIDKTVYVLSKAQTEKSAHISLYFFATEWLTKFEIAKAFEGLPVYNLKGVGKSKTTIGPGKAEWGRE